MAALETLPLVILLGYRLILAAHLTQKECAEPINSLGLKFRLVSQYPEAAIDRAFTQLNHCDFTALYFFSHRQT